MVGCEKIAEKNNYKELFNCVRSNINNVKFNVEFCNDMAVGAKEIRDVIKKLYYYKTCGIDNIYAEHFKYASSRVFPMLAMCFTGFLIHGTLPDTMIYVILVPVIKDKTGKINSKDNYRPIALASILSKIFENVLFNGLETYLLTNDNQYGFKRKHGTDMCIYALKEIVQRYRSLNSTMFLLFFMPLRHVIE